MASFRSALARLVDALLPRRRFDGSADYWRRRYARGGGSGAGSHGRLAAFKAEVLNAFVAEHEIASVIEFGCGDGSQLTLADYPRYLGFDVSQDALARCRASLGEDPRFAFRALAEDRGERAELALSLDVIYHLVEDGVYEAYMARLFAAGERFVAIYSSNREDPPNGGPPHVRHRRFTDWVDAHAREWQLREFVENRFPGDGNATEASFAEFYIYERVRNA